jgi:hypothetical protein
MPNVLQTCPKIIIIKQAHPTNLEFFWRHASKNQRVCTCKNVLAQMGSWTLRREHPKEAN